MKNGNNHPSTFSIILSIGLIFFILISSQWRGINENFDFRWDAAKEKQTTRLHDLGVADKKQRGAHVFGIRDTTNFYLLIRNNIEWVTLVSWGFQDDYDSPIMNHHNGDSLLIQQSDSNWVRRIELVRAAGFKVFVKPHIWVDNPSEGKWRSDIFPTHDEDWEIWKNGYQDFIFRYAKIAEQAHAEMFCIGTELSRLSVEKPDYWKNLIQAVRSIYSGKITYAANWYNEYEKITFWDELDYIGIQAYFPLVKNTYPSVEQISEGWNKHIPAIESIHKKYNRKILFTEMGYKSTSDSAIEPWKWMEHASNLNMTFSTETQANCYMAFFNTIWKKEWFEGVHIWQWRSDYKGNDGNNNMDFTPQGKPAETIIAKGFK